MQHGVYLTHSGPIGESETARAALLAAGKGAVLSHESVLWVWDLGPAPKAWTILAPHARRRVIEGAELIRTRRPFSTRSVNGFDTTLLPRAIMDLADRPGAKVDDVMALIAKVCQKGLTIPKRLSTELSGRRAHRMRRPLELILGDVAEGVESLAEQRFLTRVVKAHDLPPFAMQVATDQGRADFLTEEFAVRAEVDGVAFHAGGFRSDRRRDRKASAQGVITIRATWWDVEDEPCDVAQDLADTLRARGWTGALADNNGMVEAATGVPLAPAASTPTCVCWKTVSLAMVNASYCTRTRRR